MDTNDFMIWNTDSAQLCSWLPSRLSLRIGLWIFLVIVPVACTGGWVLTRLQQDLVETRSYSAEVFAHQAMQAIDRVVAERSGDALVFAQLGQSRHLDPAELQKLSRQLLAAYAPFYVLAAASDSTGRIIAASHLDEAGGLTASHEVLGYSVMDAAWFHAALEGHDPVHVQEYHDDALVNLLQRDRNPVMSFSAPMRDRNGTLVGVWSAWMSLEPVRALLIDMQGKASTSTSLSLVLATSSGIPILTVGSSSRHAPAASAVSTGFSMWPSMGWRVDVYSEEKDGQRFPLGMLWGLTALIVVTGIGVISWLIQRRLLAPVSLLIAHAQAVIAHSQVVRLSTVSSSGQPQPSGLLISLLGRGDEIGELARTMDELEREVQNQFSRLVTLNGVSRTLVQELVSLPTLLTRILEAAQRLTGARYAALARFDNQEQRISGFLTRGVDEATHQAIGGLPTGKGLLGAMTKEAGIIRLKDLSQHPASSGFPPHHPPMQSFLGTAIRVHDQIFGWLYLTEKEPHAGAATLVSRDVPGKIRPEFTELDEQLISAMTYHAGAAIEIAHLFDTVEEAQRRYRAILDAVQDGIYGVDLSGRCLFINHAGAELLGYTAEELVGQVLHPLIHHTRLDGRAHANEECVIDAVLKTGQPCSLEEEVLWRRDGSACSVRCHVTPLYTKANILMGAVVAFVDLSVRKRLEAQLRQSQKMEAIGRLAGGIAHDFNNLLTVIRGYSDLLLARSDLRKDLRLSLDQIKNATDRATGLTQQLLSFSRNRDIEMRVVDVNDLVSKVASMLRRLVGEHLDFSVSLSLHPCCVKLDPIGFEQVLINLAVNARDAMPEGGRLTIQTSISDGSVSHEGTEASSEDGRMVLVTVTDTGVGMDAETQARIFEPFYTTKPPGKGTGLGLATVYRVVEQSGGTISVVSAPKAGTTFTLAFSRVLHHEPSVPVLTRNSKNWGFETILLVEDEPAVRALTKTVLSGAGYTVLEAGDGKEGLAVAQAHSGVIHLLLTDGLMPEMNGWDLARHLGRFRPELPVVFLTGYGDTAIPEFATLEQQGRILQKPVPNEVLTRTIREVLEQPVSESGAAAQPHQQAWRILVIDDDAQIRVLIEDLLKEGPHEVRSCATGQEARNCLDTFAADLLLIDMLLPGTDGIETIQEIRRYWPALPIIAMSGGGLLNVEFYLSLAKQFGAVHTLAKPFSKRGLLQAIDVAQAADGTGRASRKNP